MPVLSLMFSGGNQDEKSIAAQAVCPGLQQNIHSFYHLTDRLFQGKNRWIELKNAHDFPFVGQKGGFERIDPDMLFGCSKGVCAAAKASAGGVIEFMTWVCHRAFGGDETVSVRLRSAADAA